MFSFYHFIEVLIQITITAQSQHKICDSVLSFHYFFHRQYNKNSKIVSNRLIKSLSWQEIFSWVSVNRWPNQNDISQENTSTWD